MFFAKFPNKNLPSSQMKSCQIPKWRCKIFKKVVQKVVQKTVEYLTSSWSSNELLPEKVPDKKVTEECLGGIESNGYNL